MILSMLMSLFAFFLRITVFLGVVILKFIGIIVVIALIAWALGFNRRENK